MRARERRPPAGGAAVAVTRPDCMPVAADLFCDAQGFVMPSRRDYVAGLVIVAWGTLASAFLADRYGVPLTLTALLVGLSLNFVAGDKRLVCGVGFASGPLLRVGIALLGMQVTFTQVAELGPGALLAILGSVALTMTVAVIVARSLKLSAAVGALAGGAVAICGASAAMAIAATLADRKAVQASLGLVLVGISACSAAAMMSYPLIAHAFAMSHAQAGFFLGASIHDVAQALGAGYSYSAEAGPVAAVVKLTRVALLAPVLAVLAAVFGGRGEAAGRRGLPWFVIAFFLFAAINSLGFIPTMVSAGAERIATGLLAAAVTATGILSPLSQLSKAGSRPLAVIGCATLAALGASLAASLYLIS